MITIDHMIVNSTIKVESRQVEVGTKVGRREEEVIKGDFMEGENTSLLKGLQTHLVRMEDHHNVRYVAQYTIGLEIVRKFRNSNIQSQIMWHLCNKKEITMKYQNKMT